METISSVFEDRDAALAAGERVREVIGKRSNVSVFLPGGRAVIEAAVLTDKTSFSRVSIVSLAIGATGVVILAVVGAPTLYIFLWSLWAMAGGVMMGYWLTGESHRMHTLRAHTQVQSRFDQEMRRGNAVVMALVGSHAEAEKVTKIFVTSGGRSVPPVLAQSTLSQPSPGGSRA